jgi:formylmethanofuran dehydrogenase subunit A
MVPVISIHNAEKDLDPENRDIPTTLGKWAIILGPNEGYDVDEIIKGISNGDMIESIEVYKKIIPQMSNEAKTMIDGGVDCHETWGNFIGVGTIDMVK